MRGSVGSVAPSGSLVAAGAGWGLGDDPALRTWSHLGSKVPAPICSLALSLFSPCRDVRVPLPLVLGWRHKSCRGMRGGQGVWVQSGDVGTMACLHPSAGCPRSGPGHLTLNAPYPGFGAAFPRLPPRCFRLSNIGLVAPGV